MRSALSILLMIVVVAGAEIIPATNRIDWSLYSGIPGGIPHRTTIYTNLPAGLSMATINSAIANCPSNQVVQLSNGIYTVTASLAPKSHITLRGQGSNTIIQASTDWIMEAADYRYFWDKANDITVTSGYGSGSSNLVLASVPAGLDVGCIFVITELNDTWVTSCGWEDCATCALSVDCDLPYLDGTRVRGQVLEITGITDQTNIAFWPPLSIGFKAGLIPKMSYFAMQETVDRNVMSYFGIEDMLITNTASPGNAVLWFSFASHIWVSNVIFRSSFGDIPAIRGDVVFRLQVEHCDFANSGNNGVGILTMGNCDSWLMENNIFHVLDRTFLANGAGGHHVFAYNYTHGKTNSSTECVPPPCVTAAKAELWQHRSHPMFILFEGNSAWSANMDNIHGSGSHFLFLRNHMKGWQEWETWAPYCISIDAWNYWCSIVGNVFGYSGITTNANGLTFAYEKSSLGNCANKGDVTPRNVLTWGWSGGAAWTNDTYCKASATVTGNYDYMRNSNHWDAAIEDHVVPNSYFYASKPSWFGFLTWPPVNNDNPDYSSSITNIPAGYRYTFGTNPPPADGVAAPRNLRIIGTTRAGTVRGP